MSGKANRLIYVASPLRGEYEKNMAKARQYCKHVTDKGFIPYAPHLLFTQFMDDTIPEQRATGMAMGIEMLKRCDELWVFGETISEGMAAEIELAKEMGIPIHYIKEIAAKEAPARKRGHCKAHKAPVSTCPKKKEVQHGQD